MAALQNEAEKSKKDIDKKGDLFNQIIGVSGNLTEKQGKGRVSATGKTDTAKAYRALGKLIENAD